MNNIVVEPYFLKNNFCPQEKRLSTIFGIIYGVEKVLTQETGVIGEEIACRYLVKHGYVVVGRNYRKKCGEIDVITEKSGKLCFVEVKSVARAFNPKAQGYRPEDNLHMFKIRRLCKTIEIYLQEKNRREEEWNLHGVIVFLDKETKTAHVRLIENINI
jgi:putative endonuclease